MSTAKETTAREYAARAEKSARWAAYFYAHGMTSETVTRMGLHAPEWALLAKAITQESGRKLLPPHSQETVDCIVMELTWLEDAREARERAVDVPFEVRW